MALERWNEMWEQISRESVIKGLLKMSDVCLICLRSVWGKKSWQNFCWYFGHIPCIFLPNIRHNVWLPKNFLFFNDCVLWHCAKCFHGYQKELKKSLSWWFFTKTGWLPGVWFDQNRAFKENRLPNILKVGFFHKKILSCSCYGPVTPY